MICRSTVLASVSFLLFSLLFSGYQSMLQVIRSDLSHSSYASVTFS